MHPEVSVFTEETETFYQLQEEEKVSQVAIVFTDGKVAEAPARAVRGGGGTGAGVRFRE